MPAVLILLVCVLVPLCAQERVVVGGGVIPDGWSAWGRAPVTQRLGVEGALQYRDREESRSQEHVQRQRTDTYEAGLSVQVLRLAGLTIYASAGGTREHSTGRFWFLFPEPAGPFGQTERRRSAYAAATGTFRVVGPIHAMGRYTWRTNAALEERKALVAGLAWRF